MSNLPKGQRYNSTMAEADKPKERGDGNDSPSGTGVASGLHLGRLGLRIQGVTPQEILDDFDFYADLLTKHHAIGFKFLHPTDEEQVKIVNKLYRGNDPQYLQAGYPKQGGIQDINHDWMLENHPRDEHRDIEDFIRENWHLDNSHTEMPAALQSMHMKIRTDEVGNDDTMVVSLEYLYEILPQHMKDYLQGMQLVHTARSNNPVDGVVEHPALVIHPVTGNVSFWVSPNESMPVGEANQQLWDEIIEWTRSQLERQELRFRWNWDVGDLFIWDNRNLLHSFYAEFEVGQRVFARFDTGLEKPRGIESSYIENVIAEALGDANVAPVEDPPNVDHPTSTKEFSEYQSTPEKDGWASAIANQDHIPLVLTKGIYALPEFRHLVNSVTMFFITKDEYSNTPDQITALWEAIQGSDWAEQDQPRYPDFHIIKVPFNENHILCSKYARYWNPGIDPIGQIFMFTKNGDISRAYDSADDPLFSNCVNQIVAMTQARRALRHAGHAWHYPDFMHYPSHKERPYRWENLPFVSYTGTFEEEGGNPPKDFLVQFAVDTVFGCFNHLKTNEERKEIIEDIRDFLSIMLEMDEHELGR